MQCDTDTNMTALSVCRPASPRRRDLHASIGDGAFFSVMVGAGETYVPAFVLALGMGEVVAGLVATVPMLIGAVLQLGSPWAVRKLGSHRQWVLFCASCQALALLLLPLFARIDSRSVFLIFLATTLYWAAGLATGPAWNTWIESLVPRPLRARFFASRTRICQIGTFSSFVLSGLLLQFAADTSDSVITPYYAFCLLFIIAAGCRFMSVCFLAQHREPPCQKHENSVGLVELLGRLRGHAGARLLVYLLAVQSGVYISATFFTPYMLAQLRLPYWQFVTLTAVSYLARVAFLPLWGRVAHESGPRRLLWIGSMGIAPLAGLWLISSDFSYLLALQFVAGMAWSAYELAMMLMFFETIPRSERTSLLTLYNLGNSTAMVTGSCLGALLLRSLGESPTSYAVLFALSTSVRLATLMLLLRIPNIHFVPVRPATRSLSVRPSAGAIENPILPSIPNGEKPHTESAPVKQWRESA